MFLDILLLVTVIGTALRVALRGAISPEAAAIALIGFTAVLTLARSLRIGVFRLIYRISAAVGSVAFLARSYGGETFEGKFIIVGLVAGLLVLMIGYYIMFRGVFGTGNGRAKGDGGSGFDFGTLLFVGILGLAVMAVMTGHPFIPDFGIRSGEWPPPVPYLYHDQVNEIIKSKVADALQAQGKASVPWSIPAAQISGTVTVEAPENGQDGILRRRGAMFADMPGGSYNKDFTVCRRSGGWTEC